MSDICATGTVVPVSALVPPAQGEASKDGAPAARAHVHTGATLTEESAVAIFVAKHTHTTRDSLSCKLATQYGITSKSVRGVDSIETACERCTVTKRRGRPPGIKETKPRNRTGLARSNNLLEDDGGLNGANLAGMNMQLQNSMGIPGLFNAPNQLFLAQQMRGGTQGFSPEMWNTMMTAQRGGQAGMGNMSLLLPQYAMAPGQEGMAPFGMLQGFDANGVPVMMPAAYPTGSQGGGQFGMYPFPAHMMMGPGADGSIPGAPPCVPPPAPPVPGADTGSNDAGVVTAATTPVHAPPTTVSIAQPVEVVASSGPASDVEPAKEVPQAI